MTVTTATGFVAAGVAAGIKDSGAKDVAVVVNDGPLKVAAGVFTSNRIQAAPVTWSRQVIADGRIDAVILNSGGANACTGMEGFADTHRTAEHLSDALTATGRDVSAADVAVCSTGLIGVRLPMELLLHGAQAAVDGLTHDGGVNAAEAIMTTDSVSKTAHRRAGGWTVGGMAKGAGMLAPGMATMLSVITTDAVITGADAEHALTKAVASTFNRVDSDGCMSTNDTVLLLASGSSEVTVGLDEFTAILTEVCADLSRQLVADAEGASHDIAITVTGASDEPGAEAVARAVARSALVKAAIFGGDPNWGRIISAVGTIPAEVAPFEPDYLDVWVNDVHVCRGGGVGDDRSLVDLSPREVRIVIDLHAGDQQVTVWSNDLTHDYVHENSAYSS